MTIKSYLCNHRFFAELLSQLFDFKGIAIIITSIFAISECSAEKIVYLPGFIEHSSFDTSIFAIAS